MAKQTIGIGSSADDGTGDPLRTAFDKANDNFDELYTFLADGALASGRVALVGTGGVLTDDAGLTFDQTSDNLTVVGQVIATNGLVGAPSFTFAGATTSGLYRDAGGNCVWVQGGVAIFRADSTPQILIAPTYPLRWNSGALGGGGPDTSIGRASAGSVVFSGATAGAGVATSRTEINKAITAFTDGVAKAALTFTVPNAAHSASYEVTVVGSMGAGGAIGANESTQTAKYRVDIARTAGVNAVATISAVYPQAAAASVAGAANIATTAALSAISGAVGAVNTFTLNPTLTKSGGAADNHTAMIYSQLLNANSSGITVA